MIEVGRVFSTSFSMLRQRFWLLLGMWAVFFAIQIVAVFGLGIVLAGMGLAGSAALGAGIEDPAALTSMGIGAILFMVVFYAAYVVVLLVQQAAMVMLASPLEEPSFGGAMNRGFKSALPFIGVTVLLIGGYLLLSVAMAALAGGLSLASDAAGGLIALLFLPVFVYLGCRLSVLVPVIAVDEVFNPITALRRCWSVTRGKVLSILLALIGFLLISLVVLGLPFALIFGAVLNAETDPTAATGTAAFGALLFLPLMIIYTMYAAAFTSALHAAATGGGAEKLEELFA